jgi:hypothetical protein
VLINHELEQKVERLDQYYANLGRHERIYIDNVQKPVYIKERRGDGSQTIVRMEMVYPSAGKSLSCRRIDHFHSNNSL